jgi:cadherin EGF LAG seven-pass G-type receptor 1
LSTPFQKLNLTLTLEYLFPIFLWKDDFDGDHQVLNVSFTARRARRIGDDDLFTQQYLQDKVYLNRGLLSKIAGFQVLS